MKRKVLSVSYSKPNLNSPHAGGKTYSFYMKTLSEISEIELTIVCLCENKTDEVDFEEFNACGYRLYRKGNFLFNIKRALIDLYGRIVGRNPIDSFFKYREFQKKIAYLHETSYLPDVIILEWTQCVVLANYCRKLFPNAKIVASEHDVSYLGWWRKYLVSSPGMKKFLTKKKYSKIKMQELDALNKCDIIMPQNKKDMDLLISDGINPENIIPIVPFYSNLFEIARNSVENDILFWGSMSREENSNAALWFIDNVMPLLSSNFRFVVVGNKPPERLLKRKNKNIVITGFVEDPSTYFEKSLCMVVPLLTGAGIKVKVIESFSASLPVLTNEIGIEGIPAKDGIDYISCKSPEDYAISIMKLANDENYSVMIGNNGRQLIIDKFNLEKSQNDYINIVMHKNNKGMIDS